MKALGLAGLLAFAPAALAAQDARVPPGPLVVFNAGSLARPFADLLKSFAAEHSGVVPQQENSGSVEAARKLIELGKIPDVLGVADYGVIAKLLVPSHTSWYVTFARNAMVLAYTDASIGASSITPDTWWQVMQRPNVRTGRSDPALDPSGYRTLMVLQLAERHYRRPGLAAQLRAAMPEKFVRPKEADLTALLQAGELDYIWTYRSIAQTSGFKYVALPPEIDLSDPARAAAYATAHVNVPGATRTAAPVEFRGEPIVYALTVPARAPHPAAATAFARWILGPAGRKVFEANGFILLPAPLVTGPVPAGVLPR